MTTVRKRYEQKTKVVTFRVSSEIYDQIGDAKVKTGLSNADLVKLGAGIAQEEIKAKLAEASGLENRLSQLKVAIRQTQQEMDKVIAQERKRRLAELDTEIEELILSKTFLALLRYVYTKYPSFATNSLISNP